MKLNKLTEAKEKEAPDKGKVSQKEAGYMLPVDKADHDKITGLFCCGNCKNFLQPHGCKGVAGMIYKGGCCNHYDSDKAKLT